MNFISSIQFSCVLIQYLLLLSRQQRQANEIFMHIASAIFTNAKAL